MNLIHVLAAVSENASERYQTQFAAYSDVRLTLVTSVETAKQRLDDSTARVDVLVLDNALEAAFALLHHVRQLPKTVAVVLVDEDADFATPGLADDISTTPFHEHDLYGRMKRLLADRTLETIRADAMPPIRELSRAIRRAPDERAKQLAIVQACRQMGFDYAAVYQLHSENPWTLTLGAHDTSIEQPGPQASDDGDVITAVARAGQSRLVKADDELKHPLVETGALAAVVCTPIGKTKRYGVLVAGKVQPNSIQHQHVLMLELMSAQLSADFARL